tara:strand:- start:765 stop:962 length:198 start_codon:yes stop_codon:yes gene_type:complete
MNDREKASKYNELIKKANSGQDVIDIEGQKWVRMHPEMQQWAEYNSDMVEWMTEIIRFPPRSDCG